MFGNKSCNINVQYTVGKLMILGNYIVVLIYTIRALIIIILKGI